MAGDKKETKVVQELPKKYDPSLITPEDVQVALSGNKKALEEQVERAKDEALRQEKLRQQKIIDEQQKKLALLKVQADREKAMKLAREKASEKARQEAIAREKARVLALKKQQEMADFLAKKKAEELKIAQQRAVEAARLRALAIAKQQAEAKALALKKQQDLQAATLLKAKQEAERKILLARQEAEAKAKESREAQEKLLLAKRKAEARADRHQKIRYILTAIFFAILFAIVFFLPNIKQFVSDYQAKKQTSGEITTGRLICTRSATTTNFDIYYTATASYTDSKMQAYTYTIKTAGDKLKDAKELTDLNNNCNSLVNLATNIDGLAITCNLEEGTNTFTSTFSLEKFSTTGLTSSYTEFGGITPIYTYGEDIAKVQKSLLNSKYKCTRYH